MVLQVWPNFETSLSVVSSGILILTIERQIYLFLGCGKTSFIKALAGHLNFDICLLNLAEADLTDLALAKKLSQVPEKSILLLEDVDAAFASRNASSHTDSNTHQIAPRLDSGKLIVYQKSL